MKWRISLLVALLAGSFCWNNLHAQTGRLPSQRPLSERPMYRELQAKGKLQPNNRFNARAGRTVVSRPAVPLAQLSARYSKFRPANNRAAFSRSSAGEAGQPSTAVLPSQRVKSDRQSTEAFLRKYREQSRFAQ